jgi:flagellar biosynthesis/type III secretory pathway chaperone
MTREPATPAEAGAMEPIDQLRACLLREYMALQDFVDFLERELKDIAGFNADKLASNTADKERRLAELDAIERQRGRLVGLLGVARGEDEMRIVLAEHPNFAVNMSQVWEGILSASERARQLNETNGRLIASQLAYYEGRMTALIRFARPESCATYGADGRTQSPAFSLASARA